MNTIILLGSMFLAGCSNTSTTTNMQQMEKETSSDETDKVQAIIETLFTSVDKRDWSSVAGTMADSVYTDYSALGGDAGFKSPEEILNAWRGLLPGFERTIHQVHNVAIWVAGERASATMDAIATHYLTTTSGENQWTVFVGYDTEFIRESGRWKLARIDLSLYGQNGNGQLALEAIENVTKGSAPEFQKESKATAAVEKFFQALEARDLDQVMSTLDEEVTQFMPLAPGNFPKELSGKTAMQKQYAGVMGYTQKYDREYFPTQDPNTVLVKYNGEVITSEGKPYNNAYVGIFTTNGDGLIQAFTEMFNPNILLNGWPGLQPASYSVHSAGASTDAGVILQEVSFPSSGVQLKGHLFLPPNFNSNQKYPAAIVTGSWTSVKEQMPDEYASLMAQEGFITLTFDFTGFGESEGQPRQVEDFNLKIADIKAAAEYLSAHDNIDGNRLTGLGVCASAGYMAHATAQDPRIKQLVLVAPWLHNPEIARSIYDLRPGGTDGLLASAKAAKVKYAETGTMDYVLAASELDPLSAMYVPANAFDYYLNPAKAAGKYYDNRFAVSSWEPWLTFDGIAIGEKIEKPVFIVHSESGAVPNGAKAFYENLKGPKAIKWLNAYNQQQLYFEAEAVNTAIGEVINYLK